MNKPSNKRFPCEECREQKRKCDCKQPCDRCERFNLKCVYLKGFSPRDQEFIEIAKEKKMHCEIDALTAEIDMLQEEMHKLQTAMAVQRQQSPPLSLHDSETSYGGKSWPVAQGAPISGTTLTEGFTPECSEADDTSSTTTCVSRSTKRARLLAQEGSMSVVLSQQQQQQPRQPWMLTVRNGTMEIETHINTYSDLLPHLRAAMNVIHSQEHVPFTFHAFSMFGSMLKAFNTMILNKYGKMTCRSWVSAKRMFIAPSPDITCPPQPIHLFAQSLLDVYCACKYFQDLAIHIPTFMQLFVDPYEHLTDSPAAMALCAITCTAHCRHMDGILPTGTQHRYAQHYYGQARQMVADRFDEACLETFATYVLLAQYETTMHDATRWHFTKLALRMADILRPGYMAQADRNESILFRRLQTSLQRTRLFELATEFDRNDRDQRETGYARFYAACHNSTSDEGWVTTDDDCDQAHDLIEMHRYLQRLRRDIYNNSRAMMTTVPRDLVELTEIVVQQQINYAMGHWYTHTLPSRLKLSLPVLDALSIPDEVYMKTVEQEVQTKGIAPVLTALALYDEGLLIAQSYLHKRVQQPATVWDNLQQFWQGDRLIMSAEQRRQMSGNKWARRIDKLLSVKPQISFNGTDDEFFAMVMSAMFPATDCKTSVIILAIQTAINTVRLLRFLDASHEWQCFFDMRVLMDVWVLLTRILRFGRYLDADDQTLLPRAREDLKQCLAMARSNAARSAPPGHHTANRSHSFVDEMEKELDPHL